MKPNVEPMSNQEYMRLLIAENTLAAELADMVLRDTDLFPDSMRWQEIVAKAHEMKAKMEGK